MSEVDEELLAVTKEQLRWSRAAALPQVRETIATALDTRQKREAFELCDGKTTVTATAKKVKVAQPTVSRWTIAWQNLGIAYQDEDGVAHLISLKALGLPLEVAEGR